MEELFLSSQNSVLNLTVPNISCLNCELHYYTIALLMHELSKQLHLAKISLLEAAACCPLYGILTCIRSILNNLTIL